MNYYYAVNGQQTGPVSEEQLRGLVAAGTVPPETLVWREGMGEWQPFSTALGGAPQAAVECTVCHQKFPADQTIKYGTVHVCAGCKPRFVQGLREGATAAGLLEYASGWNRTLAKILDTVILLAFNFAIGMLTLIDPNNLALVIGLNLFTTIVGFLYPILFLGLKGATPGKMVLKMRVVRPDGSPISWGQAIGRPFAEILSGCLLAIGYIIAFFDEEKRTLHDRMAGTRVIKVQ